jgi:hypothetical protein
MLIKLIFLIFKYLILLFFLCFYDIEYISQTSHVFRFLFIQSVVIKNRPQICFPNVVNEGYFNLVLYTLAHYKTSVIY